MYICIKTLLIVVIVTCRNSVLDTFRQEHAQSDNKAITDLDT